MALPPVAYRTTGGYDADAEVCIGSDGSFTVEGGGYRTRGRRTGRLSDRQRAHLAALAARVPAREWPVPDGAEGFVHELQIGDRRARWWGPPADVDPDLAAFVAALAAL